MVRLLSPAIQMGSAIHILGPNVFKLPVRSTQVQRASARSLRLPKVSGIACPSGPMPPRSNRFWARFIPPGAQPDWQHELHVLAIQGRSPRAAVKALPARRSGCWRGAAGCAMAPPCAKGLYPGTPQARIVGTVLAIDVRCHHATQSARTRSADGAAKCKP